MVSVYAMVGGVFAVGLEWGYRAWPHVSWWRLAPFILLPSIVISYCVCQIVRESGSLIAALVVWSSTTIALRVLVSVVILGDIVSSATWVGLVLVVAARVIQVIWR